MTNNNTTTKSTTAEQTAAAISALKTAWTEATNGMTADEMAHHIDSMREQIRGEYDMSAEDMTDEMAEMLGWEMPMSDQQDEDWQQIVVWACKEWLVEDMAEEMFSAGELEDMPDAAAISDMADLLGEDHVETEDIRKLISDYCDR